MMMTPTWPTPMPQRLCKHVLQLSLRLVRLPLLRRTSLFVAPVMTLFMTSDQDADDEDEDDEDFTFDANGLGCDACKECGAMYIIGERICDRCGEPLVTAVETSAITERIARVERGCESAHDQNPGARLVLGLLAITCQRMGHQVF